ncbi:hypothetical protein cypCar_00048647 [Cyprinus carpio]|nr:hypothetical protein cypCar_00048647 [Cyprinus carpio]
MPHLLYNAHIVTSISEAIEQHFGSVLASHEAKMATTTLPKFRLSWLSPEKREDMRRTLLQEAIALEPLHSPATVRDDNSVKSDESEENFVFNNAKSSSDSTTHDGVRKYLEDSDNNLTSDRQTPVTGRNRKVPDGVPHDSSINASI